MKIVSDAYDLNVPKPDVFEVTINGVVTESTPEVVPDGTGRVRLNMEVDSLADGVNNVSVVGRNQWGDSAAANFEFVKGAPAAPVNIHLEK